MYCLTFIHTCDVYKSVYEGTGSNEFWIGYNVDNMYDVYVIVLRRIPLLKENNHTLRKTHRYVLECLGIFNNKFILYIICIIYYSIYTFI
jgi:hypothetical protein